MLYVTCIVICYMLHVAGSQLNLLADYTDTI